MTKLHWKLISIVHISQFSIWLKKKTFLKVLDSKPFFKLFPILDFFVFTLFSWVNYINVWRIYMRLLNNMKIINFIQQQNLMKEKHFGKKKKLFEFFICWAEILKSFQFFLCDTLPSFFREVFLENKHKKIGNRDVLNGRQFKLNKNQNLILFE